MESTDLASIEYREFQHIIRAIGAVR